MLQHILVILDLIHKHLQYTIITSPVINFITIIHDHKFLSTAKKTKICEIVHNVATILVLADLSFKISTEAMHKHETVSKPN